MSNLADLVSLLSCRSPLLAVFYTSIQPYFYSYLQVVQNDSIMAAGHITQTFSFTSTVTALLIGLVIKYTHHYKYYITAGSVVYLLGVGLMIRYRVQGSSTSQIVGTQIAVGIGGGLVSVPTQLSVQASVTHQDIAAATAIFLTIQNICHHQRKPTPNLYLATSPWPNRTLMAVRNGSPSTEAIRRRWTYY